MAVDNPGRLASAERELAALVLLVWREEENLCSVTPQTAEPWLLGCGC